VYLTGSGWPASRAEFIDHRPSVRTQDSLCGLISPDVKIGPHFYDHRSVRSEACWLKHSDAFLSEIPLNRCFDKTLTRQLLGVGVVNPRPCCACIRSPLPDTLRQQKPVSVGRPIDKIDAVAKGFR
jgi:hypothetical protein